MFSSETGAVGGIAFERIVLDAPWATMSPVPVVFQHGLGLDRSIWYPWMGRLAATRPVICVDLRGHGASAEAWGPHHHDLGDLADDLTRVLDVLEIGSCHLVGESAGGSMCLYVAGGPASGRVRSVTVLSAGYRGTDLAGAIGHWPRLVHEPDGLHRWSREISDGRFAPGGVDDATARWVMERQLRLRPETVAGLVRCLLDMDMTEAVRQLAMPVLIVGAEASPFVPDSVPQALGRLIPRGETALLKGRHGIVLSEWHTACALLEDFLKRVETASPYDRAERPHSGWQE